MAAKNNNISIGGAIVYKEGRSKRSYWIVADKEDNWEIPKVTVRRGESSVRATIRMTSEIVGMNAKVLEEVGRHSAVVLVNGKTIPQKTYYYLLQLKTAGEIMGFEKYRWMDFKKATKAVELKREKEALKSAEELIKKWEKERKKK
ncbi:NUDIX domain-containing protein [Patescibacteria group bacterium]|nr:NUDIX domain-containing protein [Patescibacteria group bacterium]